MKWILLFIAFNLSTAHAVRWNDDNDIRRLRDLRTFEYNMMNLPKRGSSAKPIWTGDWWPLNKGGLARKGPDGLSPLEKLERVEPMAIGAYNWEVDFNRRNQQFRWGGHCNGLAVAGIVEEEPRRPVVYGGVRFSVEEIKGLLLEVYQGPMPVVGGRCEEGRNFATGRYGRARDINCQDINAGTFHIALGNYLGIHQKPIIIDTFTHNVVWNWPAYAYKSDVEEISETRAMRIITGQRNRSYEFNNSARRFFYVKSDVKAKDNKRHIYEYILETDENARIIGGEWVGDSVKNHPDFIWRPDGVSVENPYLATAIWTILDIAARSR